jgi:hypothetical protein
MISCPRFGWNAGARVLDGEKVDVSHANPAIAMTGRRVGPPPIAMAGLMLEIDWLKRREKGKVNWCSRDPPHSLVPLSTSPFQTLKLIADPRREVYKLSLKLWVAQTYRFGEAGYPLPLFRDAARSWEAHSTMRRSAVPVQPNI